MPMLLNISTTEYINFALITAAIVIGYKFIESFWSYRISKPYVWENRSANNNSSNKLLNQIEFRYNDKVRFYNFWLQIERIKRENIIGDFAELGVHKGKSAKAIYNMDPERKLHLFDTFEGFSNKDLENEPVQNRVIDAKMFKDTSLKKVRSYINGSDRVIYYPGVFPDTTKDLEHLTFAFVNIDADLYSPTLSALHFFYPRLSPGGVLIVHDYNHNWDGVKKAINEFAPSIKENLIEIPDIHGSVMIIKNRS